MPDEPQAEDVAANPQFVKMIEKVLSVQRPVVLAHINSVRQRKPDASPAQVIKALEVHFLTAVTAGGAAVGAAAVIPAVGTGASLALSAVETAGFFEASALFAQSVTEVHGIAVVDPDRARALVMAMILGSAGSDLVRQVAGKVSGTGPATGFWGELITKTLPKSAIASVADNIKTAFIRRVVATQVGRTLGKAVPFGVGAVIGGVGNNALGRTIVAGSRDAFGPPPAEFPADLAIVGLAPGSAKGRKLPTMPSMPSMPKMPSMPALPKALRKKDRPPAE